MGHNMGSVLITGSGGQLAWELKATLPENRSATFLSRKQLDIRDTKAVFNLVKAEQPDVIINAAAYTAVDKAEADPETAYAVNDKGCENLALACKEHNVILIHVSTDFVFDGTNSTPYQTDDHPNPINVYGASKLAGEKKVAEILGAQATIIRTAWVYSVHGNNFVKTMLRLMAEKEQLNIVYDQIGTPTWAKGLAKMMWSLVEKRLSEGKLSEGRKAESPREIMMLRPEYSGTKVIHWTDAGVASWYDFALAIQELGIEKGLLKAVIPVRPISSGSYPTPAARPCFSVIDKVAAEKASEIETIHWRKQLSAMMEELTHNEEERRTITGTK